MLPAALLLLQVVGFVATVIGLNALAAAVVVLYRPVFAMPGKFTILLIVSEEKEKLVLDDRTAYCSAKLVTGILWLHCH